MAPRNRVFKNGNVKNGNKKAAATPQKARTGPKGKPGVTDARQKIIQKKRKTVVDARDVLASMAKTQDARKKLQNLRGGPKANAIRQIGKNIVRKTDKNGQVSLSTNKNRPVNNMTAKIRQQLGFAMSPQAVQVQRNKKLPPMKKMREIAPQIVRKTIHNEYTTPVSHSAYYHSPPEVYRVYTGMSPMLAPIELRRPMVDMHPQPRGMSANSASGEWKAYREPLRSTQTTYIDMDAMDEDMDMPMVTMSRPGMTRGPSNVHSRLDSGVPPQSHGILAQPKTKVVVPVGHRIVVSNLQPTVTQDDIRELFEDIGQLLVARLVRPGTAEVIYKNLKDAQKAVDTYHNRQLDGQPMKCLLVNKRPVNNPTAPAIRASNNEHSSSSSSSSNKLVPDISTIHKVLFQRK